MNQVEWKAAEETKDWPDPAPSVDYHQQWKAFALRRNIALFLLYTWLPVAVGVWFLPDVASERPLEAAALVVVWLAAALAGVWWAGEFRCPRCRRRYAALGHRTGSNLTRGIFDKVCTNCKLTKFELPEVVQAEP